MKVKNSHGLVAMNLDDWEKQQAQEFSGEAEKNIRNALYSRQTAVDYLEAHPEATEETLEKAEKWMLKYDSDTVRAEESLASAPERARLRRYGKQRRIVFRDNKGSLNTGGGDGYMSIRVPSLKRSKRVWRNFYHLFPKVYEAMKEGAKTFRGSKLKKI